MATTNQWMIPQVGSRRHSAHVGEIILSIWKYSGLNNIWQRLLDEKFFHFAKQQVTLRIEVKYQPTNFSSRRRRRCNKSFTRAPQPSLPELNVAAPRPRFPRSHAAARQDAGSASPSASPLISTLPSPFPSDSGTSACPLSSFQNSFATLSSPARQSTAQQLRFFITLSKSQLPPWQALRPGPATLPWDQE